MAKMLVIRGTVGDYNRGDTVTGEKEMAEIKRRSPDLWHEIDAPEEPAAAVSVVHDDADHSA